MPPPLLKTMNKLTTKQINGLAPTGMKKYIIKNAKRPLRLAIIAIAKRWPEPTRESCLREGSQKLLDIQEKFFKHQPTATSRGWMFQAAFKIFICMYESDVYYKQRFDWIMGELLESGWNTKDNNPSKSWVKDVEDDD